MPITPRLPHICLLPAYSQMVTPVASSTSTTTDMTATMKEIIAHVTTPAGFTLMSSRATTTITLDGAMAAPTTVVASSVAASSAVASTHVHSLSAVGAVSAVLTHPAFVRVGNTLDHHLGCFDSDADYPVMGTPGGDFGEVSFGRTLTPAARVDGSRGGPFSMPHLETVDRVQVGRPNEIISHLDAWLGRCTVSTCGIEKGRDPV